MSTVVSQILDRLDAILKANVPAGTKVFRDRADAISRDEAPCINVLVMDDPSEPFAGEMDKHEVIVDLRINVRDDVPSLLAETLHEAVHRPIVTDATLLSLSDSVRLGPASYERDEADFTSLIKTVKYRFTHLILQTTL